MEERNSNHLHPCLVLKRLLYINEPSKRFEHGEVFLDSKGVV